MTALTCPWCPLLLDPVKMLKGEKVCEDCIEIMEVAAKPMYEARWYRCEITEIDPDAKEPEWDKVPEERRALVRHRWKARVTITKEWKLWGPQIEFFMRQYEVKVLGK